MTSKATCIARTSGASVRAVAGFAAFVAYRGLHSRAVVSVMALRFERALAVAALVLWAGEAHSAFVGRAAAFAASLHSRAVVSVVALRFERALAIGALVFGTREADSAFVGPAAAVAASLYSRAVVIVVAFRFECASAMEASMFGTIEADSAFVGPAAAFAASVLTTFGCGVVPLGHLRLVFVFVEALGGRLLTARVLFGCRRA